MAIFRCWYCGEDSDDYTVYEEHQVIPSFTVHFPSGDQVTVHRAPEEDGAYFDCPFDGCRFRYCDINRMRSHVEECNKIPEEYWTRKAVLV